MQLSGIIRGPGQVACAGQAGQYMPVYVTIHNDGCDAWQYLGLPQSLVVIVSGFGGVLAQLRLWPVHAASAHLADFAVSGSVGLATQAQVRDSSSGVRDDKRPHMAPIK